MFRKKEKLNLEKICTKVLHEICSPHSLDPGFFFLVIKHINDALNHIFLIIASTFLIPL